MIAAERLSPVNIGLSLAVLLLGSLLALQIREGMLSGTATVPEPARAGGDLSAASPPAGAGLEAFRSFTDRPLFSPSRRAAAAVPVLAASTSTPAIAALPNFELIGIVAAGQERFALVREAGARPQRVTEGQSIGSWQLTSIGPDRAIFASGAQRVELLLMRRRGPDPMPVNEPWLTPPKPPTVPQR